MWRFVEYGLLRTAAEFINIFPIKISTWITKRIGEFVWFLLPGRRKVALSNLNIAFGDSKTKKEKKKIVLQSFYHLTVSMMEFFRITKFEKTAEQNITLKGAENFDKAFEKGKGAILIMSHLGPWEYLAFVPHLKKYDCTVLGRAIRNPFIHRWILNLRKSVSVKNTPKVGAAKKILSQLKNNHMVAITMDQWAGNDELWIDFFNQSASTVSLPARLAKKTGCALIPTYCFRMAPGKYEIHCHPEIFFKDNENKSIEDLTVELNKTLEEQVAAHPEQWLWTHKRWKGKKTYN